MKFFKSAQLVLSLAFVTGYSINTAAQSSDWIISYDQHDVGSLSQRMDSDGNFFTLGYIKSGSGEIDVDPGPAEYLVQSEPYQYVYFLRKLNTDGELVWFKTLDAENSILRLDEYGHIYLFHSFYVSHDADPGPGEVMLYGDQVDYYDYQVAVTKLDSNANFIWARQVGLNGDCALTDVIISGSTDIIMSGFFSDTADFDPGPGEYLLNSPENGGWYDGFLLRLDSAGNFKSVAHINADVSESKALISSSLEDAFGNVYIAGTYTGDIDFNSTLAGPELSGDLPAAHFIAKYDSLNNFIWVKDNGSNAFYLTNRLYTTDQEGNIYLGGEFDLTEDFWPGPETYNVTAFGSTDIYIQKLDSMGNLSWLKQFGGVNPDRLGSITIDADDNIYHYGRFAGQADLDPGSGAINVTGYGQGYYEEIISAGPGLPDVYGTVPCIDTYVQKIDNSGAIQWTAQIGDKYADYPSSIYCDNEGNIILYGLYAGPVDFRPGPDSLITPMPDWFTVNPFYHQQLVLAKLAQPLEGLTPVFAVQDPVAYPNPASTSLYVQINDLYTHYLVSMISMTGELVIKHRWVTEETTLNVEDIAAGVYILILQNEEDFKSCKVMVIHP